MVSLTGFIPNVNDVSSFISVLIWGIVIGTVIGFVVVMIRNKVKYQYSGEIFKRRQDDFETNLPTSSRLEGKAGYFVVRKKTVFRIKYGMMPWQQIELTKLPDPKYMIGNKVYYIQLNKDNFVQCKADIDWEGTFSLEPVEDDLKYGAQQDIMEKERILNTKTAWEKYSGPIIMAFILIAGMVAFYFNQRACA